MYIHIHQLRIVSSFKHPNQSQFHGTSDRTALTVCCQCFLYNHIFWSKWQCTSWTE